MPFEKKNVEYQGADKAETEEKVTEEEKVEQVEESKKEENAEEEEDTGEDVTEEKTVIKSAKNKSYNAPRQDHCFIYKIKKLA